jgi:predicted nucleotidyltransferase/HEPN domain-containing protein
MRRDLDHLPSAKQREIERVLQILFEEFEAANSGATGSRKRARILKIILYGSYARGGWVDEPHTAKGYQSDFDLMIIVSQKDVTDRASYWYKAEERLNRERAITKTLQTPVNFIVHSLQQVNDGLAHGRYFFMDVAKDGVALYEADETELHQPKPKTPEQAFAMAKEYFEEWFPAAMKRFDLATVAIEREYAKQAAFDLHQTTESLYHCVLLVLTFYTPHNHNIGFLRAQAERLDHRLQRIWPMNNRRERAMFERLKDAYVKARYSKHYRISADELAWLGAHVEDLGKAVHDLCSKRLAELQSQLLDAAE